MFPSPVSLGKYYLSCFPPLYNFLFCTFNLLTGRETEYSHELKKKYWSFTSSTSKNEETMENLVKNYVFKGFPTKLYHSLSRKKLGIFAFLGTF